MNKSTSESNIDRAAFAEEIARDSDTCACGREKSVGIVVCWRCFKYRTDIVPLKYFVGSYQAWLETLPTTQPS
jgi:hypothetical protein